ncbi:MAG: Fur family transcriptional regulator [Candidatus Puniceispirillaceae bacterium]
MTNTKASGRKLTRNQSLVLEALARAGHHQGAYALLEELRHDGFKAPLQVYRALEQLVEMGLVHRLESLNAWTVCCDDHHASSPVFAICDDCGSVTEHFDEQLVQNLEMMSKRNGFMPDRSIIEIHGQCDDCGIDPSS